MSHPILELQAMLVAALTADAALTALIGENGIFDAPPEERRPPYVTIARHDVIPRDGDLTPGFEHRLLLHAWASESSRKAVVAIVARLLAVALEAPLSGTLLVTHRRQERTDTAIDRNTGLARAALVLRFFTEAG